jgi:Furin-like cysteine rich region
MLVYVFVRICSAQACKTFIDEGQCVTQCPPLVRLGPDHIVRDNPKGKYMYGGQCVKQCPRMYINFHHKTWPFLFLLVPCECVLVMFYIRL